MKNTITAVALSVALCTAPAHAQATIGGEWREDVARFADSVVDAGLAPGLAVAVSQGDRVLWSRGFGTADAETGRPASDDTAFYIASSTKALTATAVLLVAERGGIDLAAPVADVVPGLRFADTVDADAVTIERLLTMTHGLVDGGPIVTRTAYTGDIDADTFLDLLAGYEPSPEGHVFDYGNLGYNILGLALDPSDVHGWKGVVGREVLEPLEMSSTSARLSTLDPERVALPHTFEHGEGWRRIQLAKADENLHAAGGHFTTARNLIRFVAAHASGGVLEGERVFPAEPIVSAHRPHVERDSDFGPYERFAWGYGWDVARWGERTIVQRFGAFSGYRAHMSFEPDTGIGVVVLTNAGGSASPAADLVAGYVYDRLTSRSGVDRIYDEELTGLAERSADHRREMAEHLVERAERLAPLNHPLERFAGTYRNPRLGTMTWDVVAGGLEYRMGVARSRAEVFDASADRLRIVMGSGRVVEHVFPESGGPASAVIFLGERFDRVDGTEPF